MYTIYFVNFYVLCKCRKQTPVRSSTCWLGFSNVYGLVTNMVMLSVNYMCWFSSVQLSNLPLFIFRLLDTLAGRKDPSGLTGRLLVNGRKQPKNFMHLTGYVVQVRKMSVAFVIYMYRTVAASRCYTELYKGVLSPSFTDKIRCRPVPPW